MINFIMIEDDLYYLNESKNVIDNVMMNYDINYDFTVIPKYNKELINRDNFKIYIISYDKDTLNIIKYIREDLDDWKSLIIILYKEVEDKNKIIKENLFIVDYINKNRNFDKNLFRNIQICLKNYDQRPNSLRYTYKNILYNIEFNKIIYIEKEQENKRCIIYTKNKKYYIPGTLNNVKSLLDNRFIKSSRSYIINIEQVSSYDINSNTIIFKDKSKLDGVSRDNKKVVINYLK